MNKKEEITKICNADEEDKTQIKFEKTTADAFEFQSNTVIKKLKQKQESNLSKSDSLSDGNNENISRQIRNFHNFNVFKIGPYRFRKDV